MGRAIVREPDAFLMDEPLSNLDAKLRVEMRAYLATPPAAEDDHDLRHSRSDRGDDDGRSGSGHARRLGHEDAAALTLRATDSSGDALITARMSPRCGARTGEPLRIVLDAERMHFFDPDTEKALG